MSMAIGKHLNDSGNQATRTAQPLTRAPTAARV